MKHTIFIFLLLLLPMAAQAQNDSLSVMDEEEFLVPDFETISFVQNKLLPVKQYFGLSSNIYHAIVLDTLIDRTNSLHFAYVCRPSFEPEYGLAYNKHEQLLTYSLVEAYSSRNVKTNIWYSGKRGYEVKRWQLNIDSVLGCSLQVLLRTAIATASIPKTDDTMIIGLDGTTYQFFADFYTAECWSPDKGNAADLVHLMDAVCDAVKTQNKEKLTAMMPEIKRLTEAFDKEICR